MFIIYFFYLGLVYDIMVLKTSNKAFIEDYYFRSYGIRRAGELKFVKFCTTLSVKVSQKLA